MRIKEAIGVKRAPPGNTPPFPQSRPTALARGLAFHQQAADELKGDDLSGAREEGLGERLRVLGGRGGYGSGLGDGGDLIWI